MLPAATMGCFLEESAERSVRVSKNRSYGVKLVRGPFLRLPPHPHACQTADALLNMCRELAGPTAADLFCGAGGLSLGLQAAGFQVVMGIDNDAEALETHRANFPGLSVDWDLADPDVVERVGGLIRDADVTLIAGGPPCQPFSKAARSMLRDLVRTGRRDAHDERRDLWQSFLRVVAIARPPAVLMENVPDMALDRDMMILRTMVDELEELGYAVEERVVETWRYGVPQFRGRLLLVALRDGISFDWPPEAPQRVTVDNAIGDLPPVEGGWRPAGGADGWADYAAPKTAFQRRAREGLPVEAKHKLHDHITRPVRQDDAIAFAGMDSSTRYSELPSELKRYRDDIFDDKYKRLDPNDLSRTITAHIAKDGYWYIHPYQDRTLTVREAARLQTFPDRIRFAGPPTAAFRQIGNAVPPLLGEHIGAAIVRSLEKAEPLAVSTRSTARALGDWFARRDDLAVPWLRGESRWAVTSAELLLGRAPDGHVRSVWPALEKLATPRDALDNAPFLTSIGAAMGRGHRAEQLLEAAEWFQSRDEAFESVDTMTGSPHVTEAMADLAVRVCPDDLQDPVLVTNGVLRVAARVIGEPVDRINKRTHGRLAVARLIGVDPFSDGAHLGLIELANSLCRPQNPLCDECPLRNWCVEGTERLRQEPSLFPSDS